MESTADTCVRIEAETDNNCKKTVYVKSSWFPTSFFLSISDGLHAWICNGSEQLVADRASQWDQSVLDYLADAQRYLTHQQPASAYSFKSAGSGHMRLSWTLEKEGTKLEWRWKCEKAPNDQKMTCEILDFLLDANTRLSEEVVRKTRSFDRMKAEAEKCLAQSEKFKNEKVEFESAVYAKFVAVLNSKKAKLRELRERCLSSEPVTGEVKNDDREFSEEETDKESNQSDDEESNAGPVHSDPKNSRQLDLKKFPMRNASGETPLETTKAKEEENPKYKNENQQITSVTSDPDATQVLDDAEISKVSGQDVQEDLSSAAALLAVPDYTSAPKRRRRL